MSPLLLILVLLLLFGGLPHWGFHQYGYGPTGIGTILLVVLLVVMFGGRLRA